VSKTFGGSTIADYEARTSEVAADMPRHAAPLNTEVLQKAITPGFGALTFKAARGIEDQYDLEYICKDGTTSVPLPKGNNVKPVRDSLNLTESIHDPSARRKPTPPKRSLGQGK
jgi:hypothetical protein